MKGNAKFQTEQIERRLVGGTITGALIDPNPDEFGDRWYGFLVKTKSGDMVPVWVSKDPEGNGPGWLDIAEPG